MILGQGPLVVDKEWFLAITIYIIFRTHQLLFFSFFKANNKQIPSTWNIHRKPIGFNAHITSNLRELPIPY